MRLVEDALLALPGGAIGAMFAVMVGDVRPGLLPRLHRDRVHRRADRRRRPCCMMGVDPVWLGVMMAVNLQTSFLTPPFGFALFYLRGVAPPRASRPWTSTAGRAVRAAAAGGARGARAVPGACDLAAEDDVQVTLEFAGVCATFVLQCGFGRMDQEIALREANQQFARYVRAVEAGERFVITRRGKPVARLVPFEVRQARPDSRTTGRPGPRARAHAARDRSGRAARAVRSRLTL